MFYMLVSTFQSLGMNLLLTVSGTLFQLWFMAEFILLNLGPWVGMVWYS